MSLFQSEDLNIFYITEDSIKFTTRKIQVNKEYVYIIPVLS